MQNFITKILMCAHATQSLRIISILILRQLTVHKILFPINSDQNIFILHTLVPNHPHLLEQHEPVLVTILRLLFVSISSSNRLFDMWILCLPKSTLIADSITLAYFLCAFGIMFCIVYLTFTNKTALASKCRDETAWKFYITVIKMIMVISIVAVFLKCAENIQKVLLHKLK